MWKLIREEWFKKKNSIITSNQAVGRGQISLNRNVGREGRAGADVIGHQGAACSQLLGVTLLVAITHL